MTREEAQAVARSWQARGYDVRTVSVDGRWYVLVLRENGMREYAYTG